MRRVLVREFFRLVAAAGSLVLAASGASATPFNTIDFGVITPTSGSISYAGGAAPLLGSNIQVDDVAGLPGGTPLTCTSCTLNFTSGNYTGGGTSAWDFAGGPGTTITITGMIPGIAGATGTLLTGHFDSGSDSLVVTPFGSSFRIAGAGFFDTKNAALAHFFFPSLANPGTFTFEGGFNISFSSTAPPPHSFRSNPVLSGAIVNSPVSEPASMLLLASGLVGLFATRWRKRRHA